MRWITANQLETWARGAGSKSELAKVVSDLIRASASDIAAMRFPSGDKGQVRGFDGHLVSATSALNVPEGQSYWEFGTNADYKAKATADFKSRTGEVSQQDQRETTFVFVSPWTWDSSDPKNKLEDWISARKRESAWRDVRYVDGSMLETWLESRPAVAAWHARNTLKVFPVDGVRSTDDFWQHYAGQFGPPITEEVLLCERDGTAQHLIDSLLGPPCALSFVADSPDEVIAFAIAAIHKTKPEVRLFLEARTLVVDSADAGRQLVGYTGLILFLRDDAARSPSQFSVVGSTLVPLGRQQRGGPAPTLTRPSGYAMGVAMRSMGLGENEALTLARGAGRSLTALARLRPGGSFVPPGWLAQGALLLPAVLAGAWDLSNEHDRNIVEQIAGTASYRQLEAAMRTFLRDVDPPFDLEGTVWKVRAPMDAFIRVGPLIGPNEAELLRNAMLTVFGSIEPETDPDDVVGFTRPAASGHSDWLREGLATTLLLLAVWSKLAEVNLGAESGQAFVDRVIKDLPGLSTDYRLLTSLHNELPLLAEAAPGPLLSALEHLLEGTGDLIRPIFNEKQGLIFPTSKHTGVLWALETLAWDPEWFRRSVLALARLAAIDPGGRLGNRPINSLSEIFVSWNPNTNASPAQRLAALDEIAKITPAVGWTLIKALLPTLYGSSSPTSKPRLREAGASERHPVTYRELAEMQVAIIQRALSLVSDDKTRWTDLIPGLATFPPAERAAGISALDATLNRLDESDRNQLWATLRDEVAKHERFRTAKWALPDVELAPLKALVDQYSPTDPISRIAWLFDAWAVDETGDTAVADQRRAESLRLLYETQGADGVITLATEIRLPHLLVGAVAAANLSETDIKQLLEKSLAQSPDSTFTLGLAGLYRSLAGAAKAEGWLSGALAYGSVSPIAVAMVLLAWPDEPATWSVARRFGSHVVSGYWRNRPPRYVDGPRTALLRSSMMLLRFGRAAAALQSSLNRLDEIPSKLLFKMLYGIVRELNAKTIVPDTMLNFYIEKGLEALDRRSDVSGNAIAQLEYVYVPMLEFSSRKLRIYDLMASDPAFYHQILRNVFLGKNEKKSEVDAATEARARSSYSLLSHFAKIPGHDADGIDSTSLTTWIDEVGGVGVETDRAEFTVFFVGGGRPPAPVDADGGWPHRAVRDQIERIASDEVERGLQIERFNMRGPHGRQLFEGGDQERALARRNHKSAEQAAAWPRTSSLLRRIAQSWDEEAKHQDLDAAQRKLRS